MDYNLMHASLKPLYRTYNEVIKPLIAEIEANIQKFPLPLFNEIRAFNDHIAQCYWDDLTHEQIEAEVKKAERHILRIVLDCYKYLILSLDDKIRKFEKQTKRTDLTIINNGLFYNAYRILRETSIKKVREAKRIESKNNGLSIQVFEEAYNIYTELEDLISRHVVDVNWARVKFSLRKAVKFFLWILAAVISGLLSLFISCDWFAEYIKSIFL